jgi:uncharacterized protein (TIGR00730 family)
VRPVRRRIAVFGSSEPSPGEPAYEAARRVGRLLAAAGFDVVTGGYGGVMEGASRGAREGGGAAIGVTSAIFAARPPNPYLSETIETPDLVARTGALIDASCGFVVLPGKSGTLAELTLLWALHRAGSLGARPVVLLGARWRPLLHHLVRDAMLGDDQLGITRVVDEPEEAVDWVGRMIASEDDGGR